MTEEELIDEPITYSHEEDESVTDDDVVPDNIALPGHPLYPSEDLSTHTIEERAEEEP